MRPILSRLGLVTCGDESAWAVTSKDDCYRYILGRTWDSRAPWVFGMLNPSKARHDIDDQTIRKCTGFAQRGGAGGVLVVNMLAYSATDPRDMVHASNAGVDVRGEHNVAVIRWALSQSALFENSRRIAAWGIIPSSLRGSAQEAVDEFKDCGTECFGINKDGSPRHPLMLGYSTSIVRLSAARYSSKR